MAALCDLDSLLGDLERTCQGQKVEKAPGHADNIKERSPVSPDKSVNELDMLLQDLSQARYSANMDGCTSGGFQLPKSKETDAVIREIETNNKVLERRTPNHQYTPEGPDLDSKWEYMGYGIWENADLDNKTGPRPVRPFPGPNYTLETSMTTSTTVEESSVSEIIVSTTSASHPSAASSATQELDDLMSSLNSFKLRGAPNEEPVVTTLDAMLGNLKEDMDKQGVKTTQKGVCSACQKPIVGQVITALGRTWHPEHFVCTHCNDELGTQNFFERDGRSYCEDDYHKLFSPRCGHCGEAILDKCVSALDQTWHPGCFFCSDCGGAFGDDGFHEKGDKAFCKDCFFRLFAPKCGGCNEAITENYISSLDRQWHPNCFVCTDCRQPFSDGNFFEQEGKPYCETHYHALKGSLCAGCQKPISGRCITAMFRKFHPEHFVCSFCLKQLNKGTFKERKDKPYCHECHERLFG